MSMTILVNGQAEPFTPTLADALARRGLDATARGVAVAVDGEVVPRSEWSKFELEPGARLEVVGAAQGG